MKLSRFLLTVAGLCAAAAFAAEPSAPPVSKIFDQQLTNVEHELVPLAEAMPGNSSRPVH